MNARRQGGEGRGQGRGRGYSPRRGNNRFKSNRSQHENSREDFKFAPHTASKPQKHTFDTIKDHIVQVVQKTFENGHDVSLSLEEMQKVDLTTDKPERQISVDRDDVTREIEQAGFDIEYQEDYKRYKDRIELLEKNLYKAYSLIFTNYCSKTMQSRVEALENFTDEIKNDPIALLNAIKTLMHDPIRARYPFASLTDAQVRILNSKQAEQESLLDYVKRMKQLRDVLKSQLGENFLDYFVESTKEYKDETDDDKKYALKEAAFEKWFAYLLIWQSNNSRYRSLKQGLISQFQ